MFLTDGVANASCDPARSAANANRKAESAVTNVIVPLQPLFTARSGDVGSNSTAKPSVRDQTSNSSPAAIPNGSNSVALHEPDAVGTPPQQPVMGPAANEALTAAQRLIATKQRRRRASLHDSTSEVHRLHNLIQYDDESEFTPSQYLQQLMHMRGQLVNLALLTSLNVTLDDVRTADERAADQAAFGAHDMGLGPADMDKEVDKDAFSLAGVLDPTGYKVVVAPDSSWYSAEYIDEHPDHLFLYGDCAAQKSNNDCISKSCSIFPRGVPYAPTCRPRPNTLPFAVCTLDGTAFTDADSKRNKLRFQKTSRRVLARGRSNNINVIVLPPDERFDLYQDLTLNAPATAAALNDQLNHIKRQAEDFEPRSSSSADTADANWHTSDSTRSLRSGAAQFVELDNMDTDLDSADPCNYWGRSYTPAAPIGYSTAGVDLHNNRIARAKLRHPLGDGCTEMDPQKPIGAFAKGALTGHPGQEFYVCIDEGSTGLPVSTTGYMDIRVALALGLRINTRHKVKIMTAGGDGAGGEHTTFGSVRADISLAGIPLGTQTYFVNSLPGATGLILGFNEKRRLNIDTEIGHLVAPKAPCLVFRHQDRDLTSDAPCDKPILELRRPVITKPSLCPLKESVSDVAATVSQLEARDAEGATNALNMITEIIDGNECLSTELHQAEQMLSYIEAHNDDRHEILTSAAEAMNELGLTITGGDGKPERIDFEVITDESIVDTAGSILGRQMQGIADDGEDIYDLHYCSGNTDAATERQLLISAIERDASLPAEDKSLLIKAIDEVTVAEGEENELLKDFKPDTLSEEYGLCPEFVEKLKKPDAAAEVLKKRYDEFWSQPGYCGCEKEMHYDSLADMEVELKLRKGKEDDSWYHAARYSSAMRVVADEYIDKLQARGFIVPSTSSRFVSRLLFVRRSGGGWRALIDGRRLNSVIETVHVHLPSCEEVLNQLPESLQGSCRATPADPCARAEYINICDFSQGFHAMRYKPGLTQELTTFSTHRGNMMWKVASMGAQNSPAIFVRAVTDMLNAYGICGGTRCDPSKLTDDGRLMHTIFSRDNAGTEHSKYGDWSYREDEKSTPDDQYNWCLSYIDDTASLGMDLRQCDRRLHMLSYVCTKASMWMNPKKLKTHVRAADFLGNTIALVNGEIRVYAQRSRVAAFMKMPAPKRDKRQLLSALASVAWWRTSTPGFGKLTANLYALSGNSKNVARDWNATHDRDWQLLKEAVARATCRFPANSNYQKVVITDACQGSSEHPGGLAGFVAQIHPETGILQPLGFFARPLANDRERTMSPRHLERRAILATLHKFSDILSGQRLAIVCRTDHKGLQSLVNNEKSGILTQEEASELQAFNRFKLDICYAPGTSPIMATPDLLSRNLPTHADELGSFEGGSENLRWGTGNFAQELGARDDVKLDSSTPDETSSLRIKDADLRWDGPKHDADSLETGNAGGATSTTPSESVVTQRTSQVIDPVTDTGLLSMSTLTKVPADVYEAARRRQRDGCSRPSDEVILSHAVSRGISRSTRLVRPKLATVDEAEEASLPRQMLQQPGNDAGCSNHTIFIRPDSESTEAMLADAGWTAPRCACHVHCCAYTGHEVFDTETDPPPSEKLGTVDPLSAQVKSAPNILQPQDIAVATAAIVYAPGTFARKIWDRWHGKASAEDVRATNVHFENYKVDNGLLMKRVLAGNAENIYAVVVPDDNHKLQTLIVKFYHEAAGHCGGIATWRLVRNKYVWKSGKMKKQIQQFCNDCTTCIKWKSGNHSQYASPRVTIAPAMPMCSLAMDVMDMPPTAEGYDAILVIVCCWSKYTILIPMKSKGLVSSSFRKQYPEFTGSGNAWDSARIAYKMYKRCFAIFGLPTQIRSDGQAALTKRAWPHVMRLMGIEQLVGTAYSSDSQGIVENKIRQLRRMFAPVMEHHGASHWKFACITVQIMANITPGESEIAPERLVMSFAPRRIQDLLHDVSTMPDSDIKRLLEDRDKVMEEIRLSNFEAQEAATERMMERQAGMFRDLPTGWGKPGKSWWVWLHKKFYARADQNKAGSRHKQLSVQADGPFAVTEIDPDGIHFRIDAPSWMKYRKGDGTFTIKAIRAIREHHPDAGATLKSAVDGNVDHDLDDNEFYIKQIWARRRHKNKNSYEYKVVWRDHPLSEASYVPEADIEGSLVRAFDEQTPRGSVSTDLPRDIAAYLKKFPGVLKTFSSTALQDDADFNAETKENDEKKKKKKKTERRHRRSASEDGKTQTKTSTAASKWTDTTAAAAPSTTRSKKSGRLRTQVQKFALIQEPGLQLRLLDQLNELCITDIDEFERAVCDLTFANDVARDYFDTTLLCGWMGEFGNSAVHLTDQEETRQPETTAGITDDSNLNMDGARRRAKGGRLPRPVFNMASGTTFTSNTKVEMETSPIFPARVEIIQGGGFEKPQIIQPEGSRSDTCRSHGARGAARGRYLNTGL